MSILIDTQFKGTATASITTSTPDVGIAALTSIGSSDNAVIDTGGKGCWSPGGTAGTSRYQVGGPITGTLIDASMQLKFLTNITADVLLHVMCKLGVSPLFTFNIDFGVIGTATGPSSWALIINGSNTYLGTFTADPNRLYVARCVVTPYNILLFVDGTLVFQTGYGTDSLAPPSPTIVFIEFLGNPATSTTGFHLERVRVKTANPRPNTRGVPAGLLSELQNHTVGLAMCFNVLLTDGTVFGFTTHDQDIVIGPTTYYAMSSVTSTNIRFEVGGNPGNFDMNGLLSSDLITETDLLAGRFDNAQLTVMLVDWTNLSNGTVTLLRGNIGDITVVDGQYTAAVRSMMQWYQQQQVEVTSPSCRVYHLGDARCKFNLAGNVLTGAPDPAQSTGTIATVVDPYTLTFTGGVIKAGFYNAGTLQGLTGANTHYIREVKLHSNNNSLDTAVLQASGLPFSNLSYKAPLNFSASVSPTFTIPAGIWHQVQLLVNNTWSLRHALTVGTDQLCVQAPVGQANDTVLRASSNPQTTALPANFSDRRILGDSTNYAVNVLSYAGGGSFQIGLRHTSGAQSGAPFYNITITDMNLQLIGVVAATSSRLVLHEPFPYPVSPGDTFKMTAGCDRSVAMCSLRFGNIINFRGEPSIPGADTLMQQGRPPQ